MSRCAASRRACVAWPSKAPRNAGVGLVDILMKEGHHDLMTSRAKRAPPMSVAQTKRRFSELIDRVQRGERIVVARRGKPVMSLVPPESAPRDVRGAPLGLASAVGALSDWAELDDIVGEIYRSRKRARDRKPPRLE